MEKIDWKTREIVEVLHFLVVDTFDLTRKNFQKMFRWKIRENEFLTVDNFDFTR